MYEYNVCTKNLFYSFLHYIQIPSHQTRSIMILFIESPGGVEYTNCISAGG